MKCIVYRDRAPWNVLPRVAKRVEYLVQSNTAVYNV